VLLFWFWFNFAVLKSKEKNGNAATGHEAARVRQGMQHARSPDHVTATRAIPIHTVNGVVTQAQKL
jgi:hypothetical protein